MTKTKKKPQKKKKITPRQRKFIDLFINSGNASKSFTNAGFKDRNPNVAAYNLLQKPHIADEVEKRRAEIAEDNGITAAKIINELGKIAFLKSTDVFSYGKQVIETEDGPQKISVAYLKPQEELTDAALSSICSIRETRTGLEIKLYDKQKALETLSRYVGLSNDAEIDKAKAIKKDEEAYNEDPTAGLSEEEIDVKIKDLQQ